MLQMPRALTQLPFMKAIAPSLPDVRAISEELPTAYDGVGSNYLNVSNIREFADWYGHIKEVMGRQEIGLVCELKADSVEVVLTYENGVLVQGISQSTSIPDEVVTRYLRNSEFVPSRLYRDDLPQRLSVAGELYIRKCSTPLQMDSADLQASLGTPSPGIFVHTIAYAEGGTVPNNQWAALAYLRNLGFQTNPHNKLARTPDDVFTFYNSWLDCRNDLDYGCTGISIKVNRFDYQQQLEYETASPSWAVAWDFPNSDAPSASSLHPDRAPETREVPNLPSYESHNAPNMPQTLSGLCFVVRGKADTTLRAEIASKIEELGGLVSSSVTANTNFVILAEDFSPVPVNARQEQPMIVPQSELDRYYSGVRLAYKLQGVIDRLDCL